MINTLAFSNHFELRNKSNIFSVDRGINRKKDGKLLQQCATRIDAVFCPYLVDTSINRKNIRFISYHLIFNASQVINIHTNPF